MKPRTVKLSEILSGEFDMAYAILKDGRVISKKDFFELYSPAKPVMKKTKLSLVFDKLFNRQPD